jgi:hypothetical protein
MTALLINKAATMAPSSQCYPHYFYKKKVCLDTKWGNKISNILEVGKEGVEILL